MVCFLSIFLLMVCTKQREFFDEDETEIEMESKEAIESVKSTKPIALKSCEEYDSLKTSDFWIKDNNVESYYATDYISQDSTIFVQKNSSDKTYFHASYIKGTPCGDKVYFQEYRISGEEGMKKWIWKKHLAKDPRETPHWKRRIVEGNFKNLTQAIEDAACTQGFTELTKYWEEKINQETFVDAPDSILIKTKLQEFSSKIKKNNKK